MSYNNNLQTKNLRLSAILQTINSLPEAGTALPALTNEGAASDMLSGKQLINSEGEVVTGTIATKTSSNLTTSGATVTVPAGYYASNASKSVKIAEPPITSICINSSGLITATTTAFEGYVQDLSIPTTEQLTTQAARTVTPTKSAQTAVASGVYTTGTVTVGAIPSNYVDTSSGDATASEVFNGKKVWVDGVETTGTFTIEEELAAQTELIAQIKAILQEKGYM